MNIGIFFVKTENNDAEHVYEVLQNEAACFSIETKVIGKDKMAFGNIEFHFINIDKQNSWKKPKNVYDKIFATLEVKKHYEQDLKGKKTAVTYVTNPTQGIVDYVREIEHLSKQKLVKAYRMLNGEVIVEEVKEHFLNKGTYFSTKKDCLGPKAEIISVEVLCQQQELSLV